MRVAWLSELRADVIVITVYITDTIWPIMHDFNLNLNKTLVLMVLLVSNYLRTFVLLPKLRESW